MRRIVDCDDTDWLDDDEPIPSVTASLVADLFGRIDADVLRDLRRARARRTGPKT